MLREFSNTLKGWRLFNPGRLVEACERFRYNGMPEQLKRGCLVPKWWKEQLGDPSLRMMGRNLDWTLPFALQQNQARAAANAETWREVENATVHPREAAARYIAPARMGNGKFDKRWASRYRRKWGFSHRAVNTAGTYLAYDDPYMVASREREERRIIEEEIHVVLFLIYDRLWKKVYRGRTRKAHKPAQFCGMRQSESLRRAQKRAVEKAMLPG